mmetsp:Transcript_8331/g.13653  ORF Transcript_8331/g.13653 Transcript_8331/m.13653 type:complete len:128 (+) Transcript_8331:771-1154(+)|eukprot:CAMPEP_0197025966 /NCGR_PEP_ID=MMETSP1384-20130603/6161_1 /TAXON_ID=29189 /ORGANISM="Ammonia sp." /LENGTH=127 /DNA_ID=CAMNT_0042454563 /DNA_START=74 /DNA_END=457 /DNA_ORIENTATION=-
MKTFYAVIGAVCVMFAINEAASSRLLKQLDPICPMVSCMNPCPEGTCDPDQTCETRSTFLSPGCPGCEVFKRCASNNGGGNGGGGGGVPCGDSVCQGKKSVCCNASCGICTEQGGFCTQQLCTSTDP